MEKNIFENIFENIFDNFRAAPVFRPLLGGSDGFRIAQVVRRHSKNRISRSENYFLNSESCSENTPERSQSSENGLFTPRAFFLNWGGPQASDNLERSEKSARP